MITTIVTFQLPKPVTRDEARAIFLSTAAKYQGVRGLVRKYYMVSEDGKTAGGVYLWESKADAEAMYTNGWYAMVREKYGTEPSVSHLETPVIVDNVSNEIVSEQ
ncbi:MAG: YdhR family protein [Bryobacteraceae bacterium]